MTYDEGDDLKYEVVWSANEDTTGVHEVLWSANGWWPEETGERTTPHGRGSCSLGARSTAHDLFYDNSDQARALAPHEWDEPLKAWQTWAIREGPALYFWRTDAGEEWLKRKPVPRSWVKRSWVGIKDETGGVDVPDLS